MFCMTIGNCSRCKIVVAKYHLLQFGIMLGKMANSPTCPSSTFCFVGLAYQHQQLSDIYGTPIVTK